MGHITADTSWAWAHVPPTPPLTLLRNSALLALLALVTVAFYRLYLHPLASHPGPLLSRLSSLPSVYHAYHGTRHLSLYAAHTTYGPIVRYAPNSLSFNSATALHTIYGHAHAAAFQKSAFYAAFPAVPGVWNTHNAIPKPLHARKRRVLSAAFSTRALSAMAPLVAGHVDTLLYVLDAAGGGVVDAGAKMSALTFDVMGHLCFGAPFALLTERTHAYLPPLIDRAAHLHSIAGSHALLTRWKLLPRLLFPRLAADRWRFITHSRECASARMAEPADARPDFFHHLLEATDPETGVGFTTAELWGEANVLMIAGSDTTGTAAAAAVWYLARHPEALARLRAEVRAAFGSEDEICAEAGGARLGACRWLRACIDEALRLAPPVPGLLPREVIAPAGVEIDGVHVPAGTVVGVPIWALHRNPTYYNNPESYRPQRWTDAETDGGDGDKGLDAFTPFSIGARGCIGKGVAYLELRMVLARCAWRWGVWEPVGGQGGQGEGEWGEEGRMFAVRDHFTASKGPVMVRFLERS
ncbi:cytochrome P450 [Geopyxis carbonaria]|nr:cytochrome P450 [Geopyxis carbonaria]